MGKHNINLASITDVQVRHDGKEIKLTFNGSNQQSMTVTVKLEHLGNLIESLIEIGSVARLNHGLPPDPPKSPTAFDPIPRVLLATGFEAATYDREGDKGGALDLRIHTSRDVGFLPEDAKRLFDILLQTQSSEDDQVSH